MAVDVVEGAVDAAGDVVEDAVGALVCVAEAVGDWDGVVANVVPGSPEHAVSAIHVPPATSAVNGLAHLRVRGTVTNSRLIS